jgi:anti-anti-sigma regulatory factor
VARHLLISLHGRGLLQMTLRIETTSDGHTATLRLIGRIESEHLDELQAQVRRHRPQLVLDLDEVTLVDVGVVRFLIACEAEGIELLSCAPYIREWMGREQARGA